MNAETAGVPVPRTGSGKISYLEGIRGFAALQVVLVHYLLFFLPAQKCGRFWFCWAQALREMYLFFPVDGYMAVSLFFILSGYVLTKSFARTRDAPVRNIAKRWVRLQIPIFFALAIAFAFFLLCGDAMLPGAQLNGSDSWAKDFFTMPPSLTSFLNEAFWTSLIAGYQDISVFAGFGGSYFPGEQSLDVPLWSLNIEFWGSMLMIALAWLRPKALPHFIVVIFCFGIFGMNSLVLFLVGHALACAETSPQPPFGRRAGNIAGLALLAVGIFLATWREDLMPDGFFYELDNIVYFPAQSPFHFVGMIAAIVIFLGIFVSPWLRAFFELWPWQRLGRISFALYLLHFPLLLTVTAWLRVQLQFLGDRTGMAAAFILGLAFTMALAVFFTRWIDDPAVRLSHIVGGRKIDADMPFFSRYFQRSR